VGHTSEAKGLADQEPYSRVVANPLVLPEHLAALCDDLRAVVDDARLAGNPPAESWRGFGQVVRLSHLTPVLVDVPLAVRRQLRYVVVDDPHYWRGEIHCTQHREWMIVLPFDEADRWGDLPNALAALVPKYG
jgi:hypothetical protein